MTILIVEIMSGGDSYTLTQQNSSQPGTELDGEIQMLSYARPSSATANCHRL
jgi:hypothetical protein